LPSDEGNKMTGGVWPNVRLKVIALAVAGAATSAISPLCAYAQPTAERAASGHPLPRHRGAYALRVERAGTAERPASEAIVRTVVPPDLDQRRRDGHMTPEERRLLRQHIEDAVRELYKR
jgi:hypothetical protein